MAMAHELLNRALMKLMGFGLWSPIRCGSIYP